MLIHNFGRSWKAYLHLIATDSSKFRRKNSVLVVYASSKMTTVSYSSVIDTLLIKKLRKAFALFSGIFHFISHTGNFNYIQRLNAINWPDNVI